MTYRGANLWQVLRFSFYLPPPDNMLDMNRIMTATMMFIDMVATYRLKPDQAKRAAEVSLFLFLFLFFVLFFPLHTSHPAACLDGLYSRGPHGR